MNSAIRPVDDGSAVPTLPVSDERLFDVMYQCRAIRRFTAEPVPEELLVQLVDAALHGPSASNAQNWAFVIVRDAAQKQRVKAVWTRAWAFYRSTIGAAPLRPGEKAADRERVMRGADELLDHLEDVLALIFVVSWPMPRRSAGCCPRG